MLSRFSRVRLFATAWTVARRAPLSMRFSNQEHWSGLPCPPAGVFPTQGSDPCLLWFMFCRQNIYRRAAIEAPISYISVVNYVLAKGKQKAGLGCGYAHPWVPAKALHAVGWSKVMKMLRRLRCEETVRSLSGSTFEKFAILPAHVLTAEKLAKDLEGGLSLLSGAMIPTGLCWQGRQG